MDYIASLLKNKWFLIILVFIIVLVIIHRNWESIKDWNIFSKKNPNYAKDDEGNTIPVTSADRARLDNLIIEIRSTEQSAYGLSEIDMKKLSVLTDQELEYVAKTYKSNYQVSLYNSIDNAWVYGTSDTNMMTRLDTIGYK